MPNEKCQTVVFYLFKKRFHPSSFILHPSFDIWALEFGIFPLWAVVLVQQRPVFDFPCDYPVCHFPSRLSCVKGSLTDRKKEMDENGGSMKKLLVKGAFGSSQILVGESIDNLPRYIDPTRTIIVTDNTVAEHYRRQLPDCPIISIGQGEKIKTLETVAAILQQLVDIEADRSTFLLGVGGGIVCDITGFVASTFMRGIRFGFVSTTLLSQVDASVGGKNGVNFGGYKNMVGVFNQPEFVICDLALLNTLPVREVLCGFAEIIKHGAIADARMLSIIENRRDAALALDASIIADLVYRSVEIKAGVVTRDEREHGERRKLNYGHTFGHALGKADRHPPR